MSSPEALERVLRGAEATRSLGRAVGRACRGGELLLLRGDLGAGKTTFVQGLAEGLGIPPDLPVTSPTFVLHAQYPGRPGLEHIDAYRLEGRPGVEDLGFEELLHAPDRVTAVEWPGRLRGLEAVPALRVDITHAGPEARGFRLTASDRAHRLVLERVSAGAPGGASGPDRDS